MSTLLDLAEARFERYLRELGYSPAEIEALHRDRIVGPHHAHDPPATEPANA